MRQKVIMLESICKMVMPINSQIWRTIILKIYVLHKVGLHVISTAFFSQYEGLHFILFRAIYKNTNFSLQKFKNHLRTKSGSARKNK